MAVYSGQMYGGLIPDLKKAYVNMDLLFNTRIRGAANKLVNFRVSLSSGSIKTGSEANTGVCGGIPITCTSYDGFPVTMTYPMEVNNIYDECLEDFTSGDLNQELNIVSKEWAEEEAMFAYNEMLSGSILDATAEAVAAADAYDKIIETLNVLVDEGWALADIIVVVSDKIYMQLGKLDIECCDWNIATSEIGSKLVNKFGVKALVHLPTRVISGGEPATASETVDVLAYVRELAMFGTYCEKTPRVREVTDLNYVDPVSQIIGKELAGFGLADVSAAAVAYSELPAAGAPTPQKATLVGTKAETLGDNLEVLSTEAQDAKKAQAIAEAQAAADKAAKEVAEVAAAEAAEAKAAAEQEAAEAKKELELYKAEQAARAELGELNSEQLKAKAKELGVEFNSKTTNGELIDLIIG